MPYLICRAPTTRWKGCSAPTATVSGARPVGARLPRRPWSAVPPVWSRGWSPASRHLRPPIWPVSIDPAGLLCEPTSRRAVCSGPEAAASGATPRPTYAVSRPSMLPQSEFCRFGFFARCISFGQRSQAAASALPVLDPFDRLRACDIQAPVAASDFKSTPLSMPRPFSR